MRYKHTWRPATRSFSLGDPCSVSVAKQLTSAGHERRNPRSSTSHGELYLNLLAFESASQSDLDQGARKIFFGATAMNIGARLSKGHRCINIAG